MNKDMWIKIFLTNYILIANLNLKGTIAPHITCISLEHLKKAVQIQRLLMQPLTTYIADARS